MRCSSRPQHAVSGQVFSVLISAHIMGESFILKASRRQKWVINRLCPYGKQRPGATGLALHAVVFMCPGPSFGFVDGPFLLRLNQDLEF